MHHVPRAIQLNGSLWLTIDSPTVCCREAIQKAADETQAFERPDDVLEKKRKMLYLQLMIPL